MTRKIPGTIVLGLVVFSFTSVPPKPQSFTEPIPCRVPTHIQNNVLTGGRVITKAFYLEHVSAFVITSSPASSCFITTLLSSCSNRPEAKCFLDSTPSVEVQPMATASKIAFAAAHRLELRKIRSLWPPLSVPTSGDLHTSWTSLRFPTAFSCAGRKRHCARFRLDFSDRPCVLW